MKKNEKTSSKRKYSVLLDALFHSLQLSLWIVFLITFHIFSDPLKLKNQNPKLSSVSNSITSSSLRPYQSKMLIKAKAINARKGIVMNPKKFK